MKRPVDFFLVGAQKSATTWLHRCFREHPGLFVPEEDEIHFFDIHYDRGTEWYRQFYEGRTEEAYIGDTTSSYMRSPFVPRRIYHHNPNARILVSLRNPIDRAFSHYWHHRKKEEIESEFEEVFSTYDLFGNYVATGFYDEHLKRYYEFFDQDQVLVLIFETLDREPSAFIRRVFSHLNVDPTFRPEVVDRKVNEAWHRLFGTDRVKQKALNALRRPARALIPKRVRNAVASLLTDNDNFLRVQSEYERGMDTEARNRLREIYRPHIQQLEDLIDRDLSHWE